MALCVTVLNCYVYKAHHSGIISFFLCQLDICSLCMALNRPSSLGELQKRSVCVFVSSTTIRALEHSSRVSLCCCQFPVLFFLTHWQNLMLSSKYVQQLLPTQMYRNFKFSKNVQMQNKYYQGQSKVKLLVKVREKRKDGQGKDLSKNMYTY